MKREGSMVMSYIDDIVIATETEEDHMVRLRKVFEDWREAGFKLRVDECGVVKSKIKYLGPVGSAEGIKPDPNAVSKLRDWEVPGTKRNCKPKLFGIDYCEFIYTKLDLIEATALVQQDLEGQVVLDTDTSAVKISGTSGKVLQAKS